MRKLLIAIITGLTISVAGCGSSFSVHKDNPIEVIKEDPVKAAQNAIDQAYATIIGAASTVGNYYDSGLITKDEAIKYQVKLEELIGHVNDASAYVKVADIDSANLKLSLYKTGITFIQAEIVRLKNKESN